MQIYTLKSRNVCMEIFPENVSHSVIRYTLCYSMITQGYIQQESLNKKDWL